MCAFFGHFYKLCSLVSDAKGWIVAFEWPRMLLDGSFQKKLLILILLLYDFLLNGTEMCKIVYAFYRYLRKPALK